MATLLDSPAFAANEVYEIQQIDAVEGAAIGASFNGIGVSNQPHQQLANRTAFLKTRQDTNLVNIGILQSFTALFSGSMGPNGYLAVPFNDVNRGQISAIVQWGFYSFAGLSGNAVANATFTITLPTSFSNANEFAFAVYTSNNTTGDGALVEASLVLEPITPLGKSSISFFSDWDGSGSIGIANGSKPGLTGFFWMALGF
jgi:hypothetical protein